MSPDTKAFLDWACKAILEHEAVIGLFILAFIVTMRPRLPAPFCRFEALEWMWEWFHDALKTFVNFRTEPSGPSATPMKAEHAEDTQK